MNFKPLALKDDALLLIWLFSYKDILRVSELTMMVKTMCEGHCSRWRRGLPIITHQLVAEKVRFLPPIAALYTLYCSVPVTQWAKF